MGKSRHVPGDDAISGPRAVIITTSPIRKLIKRDSAVRLLSHLLCGDILNNTLSPSRPIPFGSGAGPMNPSISCFLGPIATWGCHLVGDCAAACLSMFICGCNPVFVPRWCFLGSITFQLSRGLVHPHNLSQARSKNRPFFIHFNGIGFVWEMKRETMLKRSNNDSFGAFNLIVCLHSSFPYPLSTSSFSSSIVVTDSITSSGTRRQQRFRHFAALVCFDSRATTTAAAKSRVEAFPQFIQQWESKKGKEDGYEKEK